MDLKEQKYVCALAEYGNLTKAAERLYISQPALSIYIANLERNMGTPLFERNGKRMDLTYAGERYVEKAREMLRLEQEFNDELTDIVREKAGRIRLGVPLRRGPWLVPPAVARYEREWPGIQVTIQEGNLAFLDEKLKSRELDLAIYNRSDMTDEMEGIPLFEEEFLLVLPALHELNAKSEYEPGEKYRKIRPEWLDGQALILHTPGQSSRVLEDQIIKRHRIAPASVRTMRSSETLLQMVAEGLGIGFVRAGFVLNMHYDKPVSYYILDTENHKRSVVLAYKKGIELPDYMCAMAEMLKEQGQRLMK